MRRANVVLAAITTLHLACATTSPAPVDASDGAGDLVSPLDVTSAESPDDAHPTTDTSPGPPGSIWIDGELDDWAGVAVLATDPAGDATGAFDLTELKSPARAACCT